ncbi:branched-chain amino acid ABC transporter permease [Actinomadura mexicana]|uniref:Amino acid/amide ABC transporter membrane protein 2, HAAT family n=1 Tax=Actinomadura mexicana TaxID=134959 RepID=A0A238ULG1_9ACTN|nr:branched-chain amino acid ABC transporter permease [Actinomadura mexicana]SNR22878.1 amino acid/amide ABC transporter membrane protein 2, HAAT family [Actinomadura mexicana]
MSAWLLFFAGVLCLAGIYATFAMILNLEAGWGGLWDLGLAGLIAVGAYFYVIVTSDSADIAFSPGWPMWLGILGAGIFTGFVAFVIGLPALRLRGEYFLITTFAFAEVTRQIITNETGITRGAFGFTQISRPFEGLVDVSNYPYVLLGIALVAVAGTYAVTRRIGRSPAGRALRAVRDNEVAALALGKDVAAARRRLFVLAGFLIGITAPVYVWYLSSLQPGLFTAEITFTAWTALVIGGIGSLRGPLVGAFLLTVLTSATQFLQVSPEQAATLSSLQPLIIGVALILILRFRPQGLITERADLDRARRGSPGSSSPVAGPLSRSAAK